MTTVIYHNYVLAADSRGSKGVTDRQYGCAHCMKPTKLVKDGKNKIVLPPQEESDDRSKIPAFRSEKIVAMAGAGPVVFIDKHIQALLKLANYERSWEESSFFRNDNSMSLALIVVTDKSVYHIDYPGDGTCTVDKRGLDETVAIGSGRKAALVAATVYKASAIAAVIAASQVDEMSGGDVFFLDTKENKRKVQRHQWNQHLINNVA